MKKVWWLDNTDPVSARKKINAVKQKQCAEWEWLLFDEQTYPDTKSAVDDLLGSITFSPMFHPGRMVYCYGIPFQKDTDTQAFVGRVLEDVADNVVFLVIAVPDKTNGLYKAFQKMGVKNLGIVDEAFKLTKENAISWIEQRAADFKLSIDKTASQYLADMCDFDAGAICSELGKLKHATDDNYISAAVVETYCTGRGTANVMNLSGHILRGEADAAHEILQRLLDRGENPIAICGPLQDWVQKMALAAACRCDSDTLKDRMITVKKWKKESDEDGSGYEKVWNPAWGWYVRTKGESVPAFANPNAFYYPCKELAESKKPATWAYDLLKKMGRLQLDLRKGEHDVDKLMHLFIDAAIGSTNG